MGKELERLIFRKIQECRVSTRILLTFFLSAEKVRTSCPVQERQIVTLSDM